MKQLMIFVAVAVVLSACHSSASPVSQKEILGIDKMTSGEGSNLIEFKLNGQPVKTTGWNISRYALDHSSVIWLNITSNMHQEKRAINVNLAGAVPGTYTFPGSTKLTTVSHGSFFPNYKEDLMNNYSFVAGSFTIVSIDTVRGLLNGWFEGTVKNIKGETLQITDGRIFNGILRPGITSY